MSPRKFAHKVKFVIEKSCVDKRNFSEAKANDMIDYYLKEQNLLLYYYKCPYCSSHHLTKKQPVSFEQQVEII